MNFTRLLFAAIFCPVASVGVQANAVLPPSLFRGQSATVVFWCLSVRAGENGVRHHVPLPLGEVLQRSDDGPLPADRLQGGAERKLQVSGDTEVTPTVRGNVTLTFVVALQLHVVV